MRPYENIRNSPRLQGWCCEWCDGPYKKWAKENRRYLKRSDRQAAKKDLRKRLKEEQ